MRLVVGLLVLTSCVGDSSSPVDAAADSTSPVDSSADQSVSDAGSDAAPTLPTIADLQLWLRADQGVSASSPFTWTDMSGKNNNAIADTDAGANPMLKPTYFPNGMPAVLFTSGAELMHLPGTPAFDDFSQGITFFAVVIPVTTVIGMWMNFDGESANRFGLGQGPDGGLLVFGATPDFSTSTIADPANEAHLWAATVDAAKNISFFRDGAPVGTSTSTVAPANTPRNQNTIGGTQATGPAVTTSAALGELLFYTHALTPGERTQVESYLKARWATP
jgi:hypothetical protein